MNFVFEGGASEPFRRVTAVDTRMSRVVLDVLDPIRKSGGGPPGSSCGRAARRDDDDWKISLAAIFGS